MTTIAAWRAPDVENETENLAVTKFLQDFDSNGVFESGGWALRYFDKNADGKQGADEQLQFVYKYGDFTLVATNTPGTTQFKLAACVISSGGKLDSIKEFGTLDLALASASQSLNDMMSAYRLWVDGNSSKVSEIEKKDGPTRELKYNDIRRGDDHPLYANTDEGKAALANDRKGKSSPFLCIPRDIALDTQIPPTRLGGYTVVDADYYNKKSASYRDEFDYYKQSASYHLGVLLQTPPGSSVVFNGNTADVKLPKPEDLIKSLSTQGISIFDLKVKLTDGSMLDTAGISLTRAGITYTLYYDPTAGGMKIAQAVDSSGKDVTSLVLAKQTTNVFALNAKSLQKQLVFVDGLKPSQVVGEGFVPGYTPGSAEVITPEQQAAYDRFLKDSRWLLCMQNNQIMSLPSEESDRKEMLNDLLQLNPQHVLRLFTGDKSDNVASGLALLTNLIRSTELSRNNTMELADLYGRIMFVSGRGIAKNAGDKEKKDEVNFFTKVHLTMTQSVQSLISITQIPGIDGKFLKDEILYSFMLGVQNYDSETDGELTSSMLTSEQALLTLIDSLASAAGMSGTQYSAENANAVVEYIDSVVLMFAELDASRALSLSDVLLNHGSTNVLQEGREQEVSQRLFNIAFTALEAHASNSSAARDVFSNAKTIRNDESQKKSAEMFRLYDLFWDTFKNLAHEMTRN